MIEKLASIREYRMMFANYRLRSNGAQTNNYLRLDERQFRFQPWLARRRFRGGWLLVNPSLAAFFEFEVLHGICDVHIRPVDPCVSQGSVQQFAGRSDKRAASQVFLVARLLSDHDNTRLRGTLSHDGLGCVAVERTAFASLYGLP